MQKIKLNNVKVHFNQVKALDGLNLTIGEGDIYALLGHNGAGKTTTLRLILGLLKADAGNISVFGKNPETDGDSIRSLCGVLSEDTGLYDPLNIYENLSFYGKIYGLKPSEYEKRIDELLSEFEMSDKKYLPVKGFSTGMKKKTALIRAFLHRPRILLLDEPTNGLDPVSIEHLRDMLNALAKNNNTTIILTTHNLDEVQKICNKITIMRHGQSVFTDTIEALKNHSHSKVTILCQQNLTPYKERLHQLLSDSVLRIPCSIQNNTAELRLQPGATIAPVIHTLSDMGIDILNVESHEFDLEKLYMQIESEVPVDE